MRGLIETRDVALLDKRPHLFGRARQNIMKNKNDNRMGWIRNIEELSTENSNSYTFDYEIATECQIVGVLNYKNGMILCGPLTLDKDQNGQYHYLLKVKQAAFKGYNKQASKKGYYFKDGISGELLALFSLHFQCRFYLLATYSGELSKNGARIKTLNRFLYKTCESYIHPPIFSSKARNFAGLSIFLDSIKALKAERHQQFILACNHYARSLKEIGVDHEMAFIRLVSAVEALSKDIALSKKEDLFSGKNLDDIIKGVVLSGDEKKELEKIFDNRKSSKKFVAFVRKYSKGYLKGGNYKAKHCKITKKQLPDILKTIYDARSSYLHVGEPMHLSRPSMHVIGRKWDTDCSMGGIIDNRSFSVSQKLPHTYFFEGLVRHCLRGFLNEKN